MASSDVDLRAAMRLEPKDAVAYFRSKGFQITDQWQEMDAAAHAKAFTVAKAMKLDILEDIRAATDEALAEGLTEREFVKRLAPKLKAKGWWGKETWEDAQGNDRDVQLGSPWRLKTIYRANLQTGYMSGRYRRQLALVDTRPYWQYVAVRDNRTRPSHRRMNGRVFRWDDPIWQYLYPPNGWGCRCRVRSLTARQVEEGKLTVENGADYIERVQREAGTNIETGEVITMDHAVANLPGGQTMSPDVGWAYNPGAAAYGVDASVAQKLGQIPNAELRSQAIQSLNNSSLRQDQFARWVGSVVGGPSAGHGQSAAGFLPESLANQVRARLGSEPGPLLIVTERQLLERAQVTEAITPIELWRQIPSLLSRPRAVLWDATERSLVYVTDEVSEAGLRAVLRTPYASVNANTAPLSSEVSPVWMRPADLADRSRYELLEGALERAE